MGSRSGGPHSYRYIYIISTSSFVFPVIAFAKIPTMSTAATILRHFAKQTIENIATTAASTAASNSHTCMYVHYVIINEGRHFIFQLNSIHKTFGVVAASHLICIGNGKIVSTNSNTRECTVGTYMMFFLLTP